MSPRDASFDEDLNWFAGVCRVVKGFKNLKLGAIGARPSAFNTVRFLRRFWRHMEFLWKPLIFLKSLEQ